MIKYKKVVYLGTGIATMGTALLLITAPVSAASNLSKTSLAGQLAQTFHLNQSSVQNVIKQYYKTHPHDKKMTYKEHLAIAVKKGKITTTQEQAILTEHKQLVQSLKGLKNESSTQKKATIKAERLAAKNWAKSNNVPLSLLWMRHRK